MKHIFLTFLPTKSWKNHPQIHFFPKYLTAQMAQTQELLFQNVAYWLTIYRTGTVTNQFWICCMNYYLLSEIYLLLNFELSHQYLFLIDFQLCTYLPLNIHMYLFFHRNKWLLVKNCLLFFLFPSISITIHAIYSLIGKE